MTTSSRPDHPGISRFSAATRSGRRGWRCRWAPSWPPARCARWRRCRAPRVDPATDEEPGKILHELRRSATTLASHAHCRRSTTARSTRPRCGCACSPMPGAGGCRSPRCGPCCPRLERALDWMVEYGDADGDGFLDYHDDFGRGLANQGWKDSDDSVRFADGTIAVGPVALAEVQGYAYEAARVGRGPAGRVRPPGADRWRRYAAEMADRFRATPSGSRTSSARSRRSRSTATSVRSTRRPPTWGTCSPPASCPGRGEARSPIGWCIPSMSSGFGLRTMSATRPLGTRR